MTTARPTAARTTVLTVIGPDCRLALSELAGTHRVQRVPDNDRRGRRQTSTATVAVLDPRSSATVAVREQDVRVERMRGHGAGGQRRNKVETAVRVTHLPTGIVVSRMSGRSQADNLADAYADLQARLARAQDGIADAERSRARTSQVVADRAAKGFTHCWYRDQVTDHDRGRTWTVRQWKQGRL